MKRILYIIGAPLNNKYSTFYRGVQADIINFYNFFTSPTGGAYTYNEIVLFENPSWSYLRTVLNNNRSEFAQIVFSGHGLIAKETKQTCFHINNNQNIALTKILENVRAHKISFVADSCRNYVDTSNFMGDPFHRSNLRFPSYLTPERARQLHYTGINRADNGIQVLFSCSPGQKSTLESDGSYFSMSLLQSIRSWSTDYSQGSILLGRGAFQFSERHLRRNYAVAQSPQTIHSGPTANFPFAVRLGSEMLG